MSTIEKLFVQIFERKKSIIENLKRQTELFDQHLASMCLLDGILPPPWLWSSSCPSFASDPLELKKEELISELLLPRPQLVYPCSSSHYSLYQKPIVTADNKGLTNASCTEALASTNGFDAGHKLSGNAPFLVDESHCNTNCVPDQDVSVTSPQDCVDAKKLDNGLDHAQSLVKIQKSKSTFIVDDIHCNTNCVPEVDFSVTSPQDCIGPNNNGLDPSQSLVKIQRSKSRQKALEIRNSTKATKSHSCDHNNVGVNSSKGIGSEIHSLQFENGDKLLLVKSVDSNDEGCEAAAAKVDGALGKEKNSDIYHGRTMRSGSSIPQNVSTIGPGNDGVSSFPVKEGGPINSIDGLIQLPYCFNNLVDPVKPLTLDKASVMAEEENVATSRGNEVSMRSRCSISQASTSKEPLELGNSSYVAKEDDGHIEPFDESGNLCSSVGELLQLVKPSSVISNGTHGSAKATKTRDNCIQDKGSSFYSGRITRSRSSSSHANSENECLKMQNFSSKGEEWGNSSSVAKEDGGHSKIFDKSGNHCNSVCELLNLVKPSSFFSNDTCGQWKAKTRDNCIQEKGSSIISGRITRSRSSNSQHEFENQGFKQENSCGDKKEVGCSKEADGHKASFDKSGNMCNSESELLQLVKHSSLISKGICESRSAKSRDSCIKDHRSSIYGGRITRSKSSNAQSIGTDECLNLNDFCGNGKEDGIYKANQLFYHVDTIQPLGFTYECSEGKENVDCQKIDVRSYSYCHRMTCSPSSEKFIRANEFPEVDIASNIMKDSDGICAHSLDKSLQLPQQSSFVEGVNIQVLSGVKPNVLPCTEVIIAETEVAYDALAEASSVSSKSNLDGSNHGVEVLESVLPSECNMLVKPKQLDFDDVERNGLLETSDPTLENKQVTIEKQQFTTLLHSADLTDKEISNSLFENLNPSAEMLLLKERTLSSKEKKPCNDSSEACIADGAVFVDEHIANSVWQKMDKVICSNQKVDSCFMGSWPQHKRRKIRGQFTNSLSAPRSLDIKPYQPIHLYPMEDAEQLDVQNNLVKDIHQNIEDQQLEESEAVPSKLQVEEVAITLGGRERTASTGFALMVEEQGEPFGSFVKKLDADVCHGSFTEKAEVAAYDVTGQPNAGENPVLFQSRDKLEFGVDDVQKHTGDTMLEKNYHLTEGSNLSYSHSGSSHSQSMFGGDQNLPEFEGFLMETKEQQHFTASDGINFDNLDLPPTALGYPSVVQQLCKSSSLHTPLSHFSVTYNSKLHDAQNLFLSIPNGLLETMELRRNLNMNGDGIEQLSGSSSYLNVEVNHALHGRSHSVSLPLSGSQAAWDGKSRCLSPAGKLWDGVPLKSGSSGKRVSSIPELPSINEENENTDEIPAMFLEEVGPQEITSSVKREPLVDITKNSNALTSVCEAEIHGDRSSLASMNTELSFSGTCDRPKPKLRNQNGDRRRYTSKDKENQNSLLGSYDKKGKDSVHTRFSKPVLCRKTGLRKGGPSLSEVESKHSNIVSNLTSFIPLVQQKQAAAAVTGKRDVKVKALETAEAAKRLAEKKENERKMRKEALKLERARLEEQNLRRLELEKKNKEQKKKEVDMAAKKKQREEEERKEKERKRKRVEEGKRCQLENEKRFRAEKAKTDVKSQAPDERACEWKESVDRIGKQGNIKKTKEHNNLLTAPQTNHTTTTSKLSTIDTANASSFPEDCGALCNYEDNSKVMGYHNKKISETGSVISDVNIEQSYDISPYKGSDDEDEDEDDDVPNTKFVPSWASKSQLALVVSSQQRIEPESIFSPDRFCSITEVLLPRKLQQK